MLSCQKWVPQAYHRSAILADTVGREMVSRLERLGLTPARIVDVHGRTGQLSEVLRQSYPQAQCLTLDCALAMLQYAQLPLSICASPEQLPFPNHSVDCLLAHFLLPWCTEAIQQAFLQECLRILRPQGVLMLTTLGSQTLREWEPCFSSEERPRCMEIAAWGDLLLRMGWVHPVVDVDYYTVDYPNREQLGRELYESGIWCLPSQQQVLERLATLPERIAWSVNYEILYAIAFATSRQEAKKETVTRVPFALTKP